MRTNKLVWAGVGVLMVAAVAVVINKSNSPTTGSTDSQFVQPDTRTQVAPPAVDGDTVTETLYQVQARYEAQQEENRELVRRNQEIEERIAQLENRTGSGRGDNRMDTFVQRLEQMSGNVENLSSQFTSKLDQLQTTRAHGYDFDEGDLGWGSEPGSASRQRDRSSGERPARLHRPQGYVSIRPLTSAVPDDLRTQSETETRTSERSVSLSPQPAVSRQSQDKDLTPVATIPARSTLGDATAMTALIGIVPVEGKLSDPFPVKIIVGNENLATNGLNIPGLQGIVFEGVARGNWNLGCVSIDVTGGTYTFQDGRIQHLVASTSGNQRTSVGNPMTEGSSSQNAIGYVSNPMGVPCIAGKRVTDAHRQLATMGIFGMASNYYDARSRSEMTNTLTPEGRGISAVTGSPSAFARNAMISDGMRTVEEFYKQRNRDTFDAIVAMPGEKVVIHISQDLPIDYDANARKLTYGQPAGGSYAIDLD